MSETVDTNVLVYASNVASARQERAARLLAHLTGGPTLVLLLWPAIFGYVRISTSPRILPTPLSHAKAVANVDALTDLAHVKFVSEGPRFWGSYMLVAAEVEPHGDLVSDAHLVALMREHGISTIWSADRDFRKYDGIRVRDPYDARYADGFG